MDPLKNPVRTWVKARGWRLSGAGPGQLAGSGAGRLAERRQAGVLEVPGPAVHGVVLGPLKNPVRAWVKARGGGGGGGGCWRKQVLASWRSGGGLGVVGLRPCCCLVVWTDPAIEAGLLQDLFGI